MKKKGRRSRAARKPKQQNPRKRSSRLPTPENNGGGTTAEAEVVKTRRTLNPMQSMGIRLMTARDVIQRKNAFIAQLQAKHSARAKVDAQRIADLEQEVTDLTNQLMQAWIDSEASQNNDLSRQLQLPNGQVEYRLDEEGNYYYEVEAEIPQGDEPEDDDEDDELGPDDEEPAEEAVEEAAEA
jgi:hypothetical protein